MDDLTPALGHNNPPEPTPFEASRDEIEALFAEAQNWLDGEPIETQEQADAIGKLIDLLRKAEKTADDRRKAEAKPFDDGKAEVQARYNPLIADKKGKTSLAIDVCKKALAPFLKQQEDIRRAIAEEARIDAENARRKAEEAIRASHVETDLTARREAEWLLTQAKDAEQFAARASKDKASAKGGARAVTLRTTYRCEVENMQDLARYIWTNHRMELEAFISGYAATLVRNGVRAIPGVKIIEEKVAV